MSYHQNNPDYIHHQKKNISGSIRELIFGLEDGIVSTLGSITGIAVTTKDPFTILLAGGVIIAVESISMAVGSYLSNRSEQLIDNRKLAEEQQELLDYPKEEQQELKELYIAEGWSSSLATSMAKEASKNPELFLQEMAYRELKIFPNEVKTPIKNAGIMGVSYVFGGLIPVLPYLFFDPRAALWVSLPASFIALFGLGVFITKFSKRPKIKSGLEMLALAGVAAMIGIIVGQVIEQVM